MGHKSFIPYTLYMYAGADAGFQVRGGGGENLGVFRVKNHIFSNFREGAGRPRPPWIRPRYVISAGFR